MKTQIKHENLLSIIEYQIPCQT